MRKAMAGQIYDALWRLGGMTGCHRMPQRSFFWRGRQFPVCARCTGAFIGYLLGLLLFPFFRLHAAVDLLFCALLFGDWLLQQVGLLSSTNPRRLVTGVLCGFGLMQLQLMAFVFLIHLVLPLFGM